MKLLLKREPFLKAFSKAAAVAPARTNFQSLTGVLLEPSMLHATDSEVAIQVALTDEVTVDEGGKVLLPAALFRQMLAECPDELLTLTTYPNGKVSLRGQRTQHDLTTAPADSFPEVKCEAKESFRVPCRVIESAIKSIMQCAGESQRFQMNCVLLETDGREFSMCATEGHFFGSFESNGGVSGEKVQAMIPLKAAKAIASSFGSDGEAIVSLSSSWIQIDAAGCVIMARLMEGRYPDWRTATQNFPTYPPSISIPAGVIKAAIHQASLTNQQQYESSMYFDFEDGELTISAASEAGESKTSIPIAYDRAKVRVRLNWRYVLACLSGLPNEADVEIKVKGPVDAVFFSSDRLLYSVMAMPQERS